MVKKFFALATALSCLSISEAQEITAESAKWKKGVFVGNYPFTEIDTSNTVKNKSFADLKGKLVILDFWATWCGSCISHMPKLEELQKTFSDSIAIFAVNTEPDSTVSKWQNMRKSIQKPGIRLPIISYKSRLDSLVYFVGVPHYVWIDKNGEIIAITGAQEVKQTNIAKILRGQPVAMEQKEDKRLPWTHNDLLFRNGNGGNGKSLLFSSVLSGFIEGMPSGTYVSDYQPVFNTIMVMNLDMKEMYQLAYQNEPESQLMSIGLHFSRVILKTKDTTKYVSWVDGILKKENLYNYQLMIPGGTYEQLRSAMQEDLRRHFKCSVRFIKKPVRCLVLSAEDTSLLMTKGGKEKLTPGVASYTINNKPFAWLKRMITLTYSQIAFVDDVGMKGNIDVHIEGDDSHLPSLNKALAKYKMKVTEETRMLDVLEITTPDFTQ